MKPYWPNGFVSYFTSIKTSNVKSLIWNVLNNSFCNSIYLTVLFRLPRKLKPRNLTARNWKASKEKHRIKLIHPVYKLTFDLLTLSVQFSRSGMSNSLRPHESQHARPPCPSPTPGVHSDSRPSSQWCHPVISSSVVPISFCPRSLPASESFPMSQLFAWGGQSTGISALASLLPKNTQDWSPLEWTSWISLQSKGLSRVFSNTTVQKHQFFGTQPSSQSNSHIHTWPQERP